jgi:outer membrane protein
MKVQFQILATASALALCGTAFAQKAGSISASIGFTQIAPSVSSGNLSSPSLPNTKVDIDSNTAYGCCELYGHRQYRCPCAAGLWF